jgi:hypothetical protein
MAFFLREQLGVDVVDGAIDVDVAAWKCSAKQGHRELGGEREELVDQKIFRLAEPLERTREVEVGRIVAPAVWGVEYDG